MTIEVEIEGQSTGEDAFRVNLETEIPQLLIGENGQTLAEIQHVFKLILRRKFGPGFYLDLDISNYKKKKRVYLEELAKTVADEVALNKEEKELPAMPASERRIIHLALANRSDVLTESQGEEPERRIVIKPRP